MEILTQIAKEYGLFVALVAYVIWDKHITLQKYLAIIQTLSDDVKERLTKIETIIRRKKDE